jgi:hypothetical protein
VKLFTLILIAAIFAKVGTQETPPNASPVSAAKAGDRIGKLNSQKKTDRTQNANATAPPVPPCIQCPNCWAVEQPHTQGEEEKAKAESLDRLYRRYMWATIIGVIGAWFGICILIVQTIATKRSSERQLRCLRFA